MRKEHAQKWRLIRKERHGIVMKKHICRLLLAALAVLCCGCAEALPDSPIIIDSQAGTPSASPDSTSTDNGLSIVTEDDTLPPHSGMVRSYLTNEWIEPEVAEKRPVAVMIPNEASAIPHYNLSEASVLYEASVEGRMTRMMAIFEDWESLNKIGNVRSLRNYYAYWAFEWDACIVHIGGPFFINDLIDMETQTVLTKMTGKAISPFSEPGTVLLPIMPMYQAPVLQRQSTNTVIPRQTEGCGTATITILPGKQFRILCSNTGKTPWMRYILICPAVIPLPDVILNIMKRTGCTIAPSIWLAVQTVLIQTVPQESSSVLKIF